MLLDNAEFSGVLEPTPRRLGFRCALKIEISPVQVIVRTVTFSFRVACSRRRVVGSEG